MTVESFVARYRPVLLGWLTDAYAMRRLPPSEFGQLVDGQLLRLTELLRKMHGDLVPPPKLTVPPVIAPANGNGQVAAKVRT